MTDLLAGGHETPAGAQGGGHLDTDGCDSVHIWAAVRWISPPEPGQDLVFRSVNMPCNHIASVIAISLWNMKGNKRKEALLFKNKQVCWSLRRYGVWIGDGSVLLLGIFHSRFKWSQSRVKNKKEILVGCSFCSFLQTACSHSSNNISEMVGNWWNHECNEKKFHIWTYMSSCCISQNRPKKNWPAKQQPSPATHNSLSLSLTSSLSAHWWRRMDAVQRRALSHFGRLGRTFVCTNVTICLCVEDCKVRLK